MDKMPEEIWARPDTHEGVWAYKPDGYDNETKYIRADRVSVPKGVRDSLEKLLGYFGGPVGVSMQELGHDAYVDVPMKVRIGDLIEAREALRLIDGGG